MSAPAHSRRMIREALGSLAYFASILAVLAFVFGLL